MPVSGRTAGRRALPSIVDAREIEPCRRRHLAAAAAVGGFERRLDEETEAFHVAGAKAVQAADRLILRAGP